MGWDRDVHNYNDFHKCAIRKYLKTGLPFLNDLHPITFAEYIERRDRLAQALFHEGVDAFVVEPGYTFQYYANVSQTDWEPWEPEERPFLMVVSPLHGSDGQIAAQTRFLAPAFEAERVRLLGMPLQDEVGIVTYEEHWNPYATLYNATSSAYSTPPKFMVDEETRDFIQRGLSGNGFKVIGLGGEVEKVRQIKSQQEIDIIRAVNTGTVEAIRAMRQCMIPGLTEQQARQVLDDTLRAGGLEPFFDVVLFDENASNPHGGTNGSKVLEANTFVLIDVGAHLYGYSSDVTRTFFPPFNQKADTNHAHLQQKLDVWDIVLDAQTASIAQIRENNTAAGVDIAARKVIEDAGYGEQFTHRLGHGIGIKAHESPYLNKGNSEDILRADMVFTSEPGIYLVDQFGVRHEDVFLIREGEEAECLSGTRAVDPWTP